MAMQLIKQRLDHLWKRIVLVFIFAAVRDAISGRKRQRIDGRFDALKYLAWK